ncbi:MAG: hypothetical protein ABJE47_24715 [bacterium]
MPQQTPEATGWLGAAQNRAGEYNLVTVAGSMAIKVAKKHLPPRERLEQHHALKTRGSPPINLVVIRF